MLPLRYQTILDAEGKTKMIKYPTHTCIDELVDVLDDERWAEVEASRKTCPACKFNLAEDLRIEDLAKALNATGKARVTIIRSAPKVKSGTIRDENWKVK